MNRDPEYVRRKERFERELWRAEREEERRVRRFELGDVMDFAEEEARRREVDALRGTGRSGEPRRPRGKEMDLS